MERFYYQFTLHKYFNFRGVDLEVRALPSRYVISQQYEITEKRASEIAIDLVLAERMLTSEWVEFGRVVVLPLTIGKAFTFDTRGWTCAMWNDSTETDLRFPLGLRGGTMLQPHGQLTIRHNRAHGQNWRKILPFTVSANDLRGNQNYEDIGYKIKLLTGGSTGSWCFPVYREIVEAMGSLDVSMDLAPLGIATKANAGTGRLMMSGAAYYLNLEMWYQARGRAMRSIDFMFREIDWRISKLLRMYFEARNGFTFDEKLLPPDLEPVMRLARYICSTWIPLAFWLGYTVPAGSPTSIYMYPFMQRVDGQVTPKLKPKCAKLVFQCVQHLYALDTWLDRNFSFTDYYYPKSQMGILKWHPPYGVSGTWPRRWDWDSTLDNSTNTRYSKSWNRSVVENWEKMNDFIFDVVDTFNLLQEVFIWSFKRPRLSISERHEHQQLYAPSNSQPTAPMVFESVPLWTIRPFPRPELIELPPPEPNTATVTITPPATTPVAVTSGTAAVAGETEAQRLKRINNVHLANNDKMYRDWKLNDKYLKETTGIDVSDLHNTLTRPGTDNDDDTGPGMGG